MGSLNGFWWSIWMYCIEETFFFFFQIRKLFKDLLLPILTGACAQTPFKVKYTTSYEHT